MTILSEEQNLLVNTAQKMSEAYFAANARQWDRTCTPPLANLEILSKHGLLGMGIPKEYGGPGAGTLDLILVTEQIARCCPNTAMIMGVGDGAPCRAIAALGTDAQKSRYLPGFVTGAWRAAWGMSEANAGSDIGAIQTKATLKNDHYILNGSKLWCSMAQIANIFVVVARMSEAPGLQGVGALIVEAPTPGMKIGKHLDLIGLRGSGMAEVSFEDCEVPQENLLLRPGEMKRLLSVFNVDRLTNPAVCLGATTAALDHAKQFLVDRRQYGQRLADFQGLQWRLADMAIDVEASRALLYQTANKFDCGQGRSLDVSITKTYANEMSVRVTNMAMQLMGACGLSSEFPVEQLYRDVRGFSVGYGTTEIQRNLIARELLSGMR